MDGVWTQSSPQESAPKLPAITTAHKQYILRPYGRDTTHLQAGNCVSPIAGSPNTHSATTVDENCPAVPGAYPLSFPTGCWAETGSTPGFSEAQSQFERGFATLIKSSRYGLLVVPVDGQTGVSYSTDFQSHFLQFRRRERFESPALRSFRHDTPDFACKRRWQRQTD